jgi:hypothetical protein
MSQGMPPTLPICNKDSLGESIQREFPDTKVVKALNTVNCLAMIDPGRVNGAHDIFRCGNDAGAKKQVASLLDQFGWKSIIDLGDIANARHRAAASHRDPAFHDVRDGRLQFQARPQLRGAPRGVRPVRMLRGLLSAPRKVSFSLDDRARRAQWVGDRGCRYFLVGEPPGILTLCNFLRHVASFSGLFQRIVFSRVLK